MTRFDCSQVLSHECERTIPEERLTQPWLILLEEIDIICESKFNLLISKLQTLGSIVPNDETLKERLFYYAQKGFSIDERLGYLKRDLGYSIQ
jgi:hypothetical protein